MFLRKIFGKFIASKKPRNIPGLTGKTERILTKCLDLSSVLLNHIINTVKKQALFVANADLGQDIYEKRPCAAQRSPGRICLHGSRRPD